MFCGGACVADRPKILTGPVAQWTTRLTTNQKIAGSSPARIGNRTFFSLFQHQILAKVYTVPNV